MTIILIVISIIMILMLIFWTQKENYGGPPGRMRALISSRSNDQPRDYLRSSIPNDLGLSNVNWGAANPVYEGNSGSSIANMIMRSA